MKYDSLSDFELVALLRQGDQLAFQEIFLRYDKLLFLFAFRKLREKEEAKDVIQDVLSWVWNNRQRLPESTPLSSYLYKAVLNRIFDIFRHQNTIQKWIDQGSYQTELNDESTDFLIREKDIQAIVDQEIAGMPPRMREIYQLKRVHDLSVKSIAEQLGISEHTVSTQLKRALKLLRKKLGPAAFVLYIL